LALTTLAFDRAGSVDDRLPTPLYHQIYLILRGRILEGTYARDDLVPGEQEIARLFGVSRITAKRALDELAAAGLVVRERGRGTRVRLDSPARPLESSVEGLLENLLVMGLETQVRVVQEGFVPAPEDAANALGVEPGTKVHWAIRVRSLQSQPLSFLTTYVPADVAHSFDRGALQATPLLVLLERCGVVVSSAEQTISAALADTQVAPLLDVEVGSPLLFIRRTVFDQDGRAVEFIKALYRPDRFQHRMTLTRIHGKGRNLWSASESVSGGPSPRLRDKPNREENPK